MTFGQLKSLNFEKCDGVLKSELCCYLFLRYDVIKLLGDDYFIHSLH